MTRTIILLILFNLILSSCDTFGNTKCRLNTFHKGGSIILQRVEFEALLSPGGGPIFFLNGCKGAYLSEINDLDNYLAMQNLSNNRSSEMAFSGKLTGKIQFSSNLNDSIIIIDTIDSYKSLDDKSSDTLKYRISNERKSY